jgi:hypothetical protein
MIDVDDLAAQTAICLLRLGKLQAPRIVNASTQVRERHSNREMASNRGKDIAPVEHMADIRPPVPGLVQVDDLDRLSLTFGTFKQQGQHAVIRTDEALVSQPGGNRPADCANARVDHDDVNRIFRENRAPNATRSAPLRECSADRSNG